MTDTEWQFDVGYTTQYPVIPDQHTSRVTVLAETYGEAMFLAAGMVMRPGVVMPTSTQLVL